MAAIEPASAAEREGCVLPREQQLSCSEKPSAPLKLGECSCSKRDDDTYMCTWRMFGTLPISATDAGLMDLWNERSLSQRGQKKKKGKNVLTAKLLAGMMLIGKFPKAPSTVPQLPASSFLLRV